MTSKRVAPFLDFEGNRILEGDTIRHPTGDTAAVAYDEKRADDVGRWRAIYADGESLWLGNQIGSKGMAVVVPV